MCGEVSIHAPARGATGHGRRRGNEKMFQSTRPRGARPDFMGHIVSLVVSIHAPARGATSGIVLLDLSTRFNPRARAGRDADDLVVMGKELAVSIHAPARGATCLERILAISLFVSIHAPARGATRNYL